MSTYRCAVIKTKGGQFELEEREIPKPARDQVLIKVAACGVCLGDALTVNEQFGCKHPCVPGHEVIGHVAAVGDDVQWPAVGSMVGLGWHGSHCLFCEPCRSGDFGMCKNKVVTGVQKDGGFAEYVLTHWTGVAKMPDDLDPVEAAPLLCAGLTVFNAIRHQEQLRPGTDLVAVQGIGGLGHLGIQFAKKLGYRVAAISSSASKYELVKELGADYYIDASKEAPSKQLQALGGAKLILATAPSSKSMEDLVNGLGSNGRVVIVGADHETFGISPLQLIPNRGGVTGWASGIASDSTDTCFFAKSQGVTSMNEVYSLDQVQEAYDRMLSGKARFRLVIKP